MSTQPARPAVGRLRPPAVRDAQFTRLEDRGLLTRYLCADDRRGIYTEVTPAGRALLDLARPTHDAALGEALDDAERRPELAPLAAVLRAHTPQPQPASQ